MFLRRVLNRQCCSNYSTEVQLNRVIAVDAVGFRNVNCSFIRNNEESNFDNNRSRLCSGECPGVSYDVNRLLSIEDRYELYQYLRRLIVSDKFFEAVQRLVRENEKSLTFPQILTLVDTYSWNHRTEGVDMMRKCAERSHTRELSAHGDFTPHEILCENPNEPTRSLSKLLDMATSRSHLKGVVLTQAELLLNRVISRESRSVVDKVNKFLVHNCSPEFRGPLLCSTWMSFYLSPYDGDQIRADNIFRANEKLMSPHLDLTLSSFAQHLLEGRQINRYYALLQLFSKKSHQKKTSQLLEKLFLHFYQTNNIRGCLTCDSLARDLHLELSHDVRYKCDLMKRKKSMYLDRLNMTFVF